MGKNRLARSNGSQEAPMVGATVFFARVFLYLENCVVVPTFWENRSGFSDSYDENINVGSHTNPAGLQMNLPRFRKSSHNSPKPIPTTRMNLRKNEGVPTKNPGHKVQEWTTAVHSVNSLSTDRSFSPKTEKSAGPRVQKKTG
ncbi:hypothetical protein EFP84_14470 [Leptospira kmetyi]|uniref:Uncharacterized protein n=2 Tax=Leptospira kmetyi TaxID=408139 RepID=A0AAD0UQC6_9LEPT|nr:hypothetical protein EFP84_14470 [Leptospira kmetyi]